MSSRKNPNQVMIPLTKKSNPRKTNNHPLKSSHKREIPSHKYPQLAISSTGAIDCAHLFFISFLTISTIISFSTLPPKITYFSFNLFEIHLVIEISSTCIFSFFLIF